MKHQPLTRKEQKAATRALLKKSAQKCFEEKGYNQTQIADISKVAGVAQGTFYVHFLNKEALLDELLDEFNQGLRKRMMGLWTELPVKDTNHFLYQIAGIFLDYWQENIAFVEIYAQKAVLGTSLTNLRDGINPVMLSFLKNGLQSLAHIHKVKLAAPELLIQGLLALWLRIGLQALFNEAISRKQAEDVLVKMTRGVLQAYFPNLK